MSSRSPGRIFPRWQFKTVFCSREKIDSSDHVRFFPGFEDGAGLTARLIVGRPRETESPEGLHWEPQSGHL